MRITFQVHSDALTKTRLTAKKIGESLNPLIRDHLEGLAGEQHRAEAAEAYKQSALASRYQLNGWQFDRDQINTRTSSN
jgi:hypothetical protein